MVRTQNLLTNAIAKKQFHHQDEENNSTEFAGKNDDKSSLNTRPSNPQDLEWLAEMERIVLKNLPNLDFTLETLSSFIFLSPRQIRRRLKQLTGLSFSQYLREVRFREARRLLEMNEVKTIKEVSYKIGFRDVKYFSQQFKKQTGKSPSTYLK